MSLDAAAKAQIVKELQQSANDTGSSSVQIALLSERIKYLTDHLKKFPKDNHTGYGLRKLVSRRRRLLTYLKRIDLQLYKNILQKLDMRG